MKSRIVTMMSALVAIAFFVSCAGLPKVELPGAKSVAKKAVTEATVEVLEVNVEKVTWESSLSGKMYGVKVTGKAVYHPAKVDAKAFIEAARGKEFVFALYDAKGLKLPVEVTFDKGVCGEYGKPENVVANDTNW